MNPSTLVEVLQQRAADTPDGLAFLWLVDGETEGQRLTWAELDRRARLVACHLVAEGLRGQPALLAFPEDGLDFLVALFGCFYGGVVAIPAPVPRFSSRLQRLRALALDSRPARVLTVSRLVGRLEEGLEVPCLALDDLAAAPATPLALPDPGDLAYLQYTSGSTARPRGCMISHHNLLSNLKMLQQAWAIPPGRAIVSWLPLFHDMGLVGDALHAVRIGSRCILMPPLAFLARPARWLQAISRYRAFSSGGPDFAFDLCVRRCSLEEKANLDLSRWQVACNASEPVRPGTLERFCAAFASCGFQPAAFRPSYGLAEATAQVTSGPTTTLGLDARALEQGRVAPGAHLLVGAGPAWADCRVEIVDPQTLVRCPEDQIGEIWVSGPHVAGGYWNHPDESERVFRARLEHDGAPFLRTGDLGFLRQGILYVAGRLKDVLILRGRTIYPQDLELSAEACHEAYRPGHGAAFPVELQDQERLAFAWELANRATDPEEAMAALRQAIALEHGLDVHAIVLVRRGTIPRTSSGKVQRHACRTMFLEGGFQEIACWTAPEERVPAERAEAAGSSVLEWILDWLAARLGQEPQSLDPHRSLLDLGLNSLRAVELVGDLEKWLGCPVDPTLPWNHPTPGGMAAALAGELPEAAELPPRKPAHEAVAVVGMGCRFPGGADSPDALWNLLERGGDAIGEVPAERNWPQEGVPARIRQGGFLPAVDGFDSEFFHLAPGEADSLDPQHRLLLEVTWEALEHAGIPPDGLQGSATGVFVGISGHDYEGLLRESGHRDAWTGTGNTASLAAGRISYHLGLQGPSMAVDTACSSSLLAIHLAIQSLLAGECRMALAGGVNLVLSPENSLYFADLGALAPDGRCKSFDAAADGYGRSEGCGVVVLKPLAKARRDGDRVLAVLRGSAANQDGHSNGLTAPSGPAQQAVLKQALRAAGKPASSVGYVEAHGAGTPLGDPVELHALGAVLGRERPADAPLWVGSLKTNLGHTEAAAGVAGLIKAVLILQHEAIPKNLHLHNPSPLASWTGLRVPQDLTPWPACATPRVAGVSAFGLAGTNVHVILEEAPEVFGPASPEVSGHLLPLSARTARALAEQAARYRAWLEAHPQVDLADLCHTAGAGRAHFRHRLALRAESLEQLRQDLAGVSVDQGRPSRPAPDLQERANHLQEQLSGTGDRASLLEALGDLYVRGAELDWKGVTPPGRRLALPTYPWQRRRHWLPGATSGADLFYQVQCGRCSPIPRPADAPQNPGCCWEQAATTFPAPCRPTAPESTASPLTRTCPRNPSITWSSWPRAATRWPWATASWPRSAGVRAGARARSAPACGW